MLEAQSVLVPKGTWYGCRITFEADEEKEENAASAVAMGRIVSDGAWYLVIAGMAVLPEHQRKGLGDVILKHLLAHIRANAPEGDPPRSGFRMIHDEPAYNGTSI
jgi:GNAT superfamily N-acetyltransferase